MRTWGVCSFWAEMESVTRCAGGGRKTGSCFFWSAICMHYRICSNRKGIKKSAGEAKSASNLLSATCEIEIHRRTAWSLAEAIFFSKTDNRPLCWMVQDAYVYLKNPPPEFLPKVGVITISGLAGIVLARKDSRFKKIAYPLGLTTLGISVCYPAQSVVFAKVTGKKLFSASHQTYEAVRSIWAEKEDVTKLQQESKSVMQEDKKKTDISPTKPESAIKSRSFNRTESSPVESWSTKDPVPSAGPVKTPKFKPDPKLMDHGQSSPEDVDMYSTRS
uniref:MICOS complex subunit n=1 Tax=Falco tinnunculus TaxID=100819 RepID=A0A8C4TUP4_FALTI